MAGGAHMFMPFFMLLLVIARPWPATWPATAPAWPAISDPAAGAAAGAPPAAAPGAPGCCIAAADGLGAWAVAQAEGRGRLRAGGGGSREVGRVCVPSYRHLPERLSKLVGHPPKPCPKLCQSAAIAMCLDGLVLSYPPGPRSGVLG